MLAWLGERPGVAKSLCDLTVGSGGVRPVLLGSVVCVGKVLKPRGFAVGLEWALAGA